MAYLRERAMPSALAMPARARRVISTGNWKQSPKAKISRMVSETYSLTLGSNSTGSTVEEPGDSKPMKKLQAKGRMT